MHYGEDGFIYGGGHFAGVQYFDTAIGPQRLETAPLDYADVFIAKLDPDSGLYVWVYQIRGTAIERLSGLTLDLSGNLYVGINSVMQAPPSSASLIVPTSIYPSATDPASVITYATGMSISTLGPQFARTVLMKLSCADGSLVWATNTTVEGAAAGQFAITALTWASSAKTGSTDALYAVGYYGSTTTLWGLPPFVLKNSRGYDMFLVRMDPQTGAFMQVGTGGSVDTAGAVVVNTIKVDPRGRIWLGGRTRGKQWFDGTPNPYPYAFNGTAQWDLFVARFDGATFACSFASWGGSTLRTDEVMAVEMDPTGDNVYVTAVVGDGALWYGYPVRQTAIVASAIVLAKFTNPVSDLPNMTWITAAGVTTVSITAPSIPLRNAIAVDPVHGDVYVPFLSMSGGNLTAYSFANSNATGIKMGGPVITSGTTTGQNDLYLCVAKYNSDGTIWWVSTDGPVTSETRIDVRALQATPAPVNMQFPNWGTIVYGPDARLRVGSQFRGSVQNCIGTVGPSQSGSYVFAPGRSVLSVPTGLGNAGTGATFTCPSTVLFLVYTDINPCLDGTNGGCVGQCVYDAFGTNTSYACAPMINAGGVIAVTNGNGTTLPTATGGNVTFTSTYFTQLNLWTWKYGQSPGTLTDQPCSLIDYTPIESTQLVNVTCVVGSGSGVGWYISLYRPGTNGIYANVSSSNSFSYPACASNPCLNGATCTDEGPYVYHCSCAAGWKGQNCSVVVVSSSVVSSSSISSSAISSSSISSSAVSSSSISSSSIESSTAVSSSSISSSSTESSTAISSSSISSSSIESSSAVSSSSSISSTGTAVVSSSTGSVVVSSSSSGGVHNATNSSSTAISFSSSSSISSTAAASATGTSTGHISHAAYSALPSTCILILIVFGSVLWPDFKF